MVALLALEFHWPPEVIYVLAEGAINDYIDVILRRHGQERVESATGGERGMEDGPLELPPEVLDTIARLRSTP